MELEDNSVHRQVIRACPHCKQPYQTTVGLHNWKNLFRKPTLDDFLTLFIIILVIAAYFAYQSDTKTCRETLNNIKNICAQYCLGIAQETIHGTIDPISKINISLIDNDKNKTTNSTVTN